MTRQVTKWYKEPVLPTLVQELALLAVHYRGDTAFQSVPFAETEPLGLTLVLDGWTQSAQGDEFVYHEALVHAAMVAHPAPRRVFIAGGGEGATLREVLAHRTVEQAVMVDLDRELVELCRERLPQWNDGAFDDPRTVLRYDDALKHLDESRERFDVIIVDVTDPDEGGPSYLLYTDDFYRLARERLSPGGLLVTQSGPASMRMTHVLTAVNRTMREAFPEVRSARFNMPSFGCDWSITVGSEDPSALALPPAEIDRRIAERVTRPLRLYDGTAHQGLFGLSRWLRLALAEETRVIRKDEPLFLDLV